ncbi:MAG: hypothetical protein DWH73_03695 [Planctomycetota bacterium]|nr:MAG: hypothetical protein DWH73_03695 [Planctomycetota bacterium]
MDKSFSQPVAKMDFLLLGPYVHVKSNLKSDFRLFGLTRFLAVGMFSDFGSKLAKTAAIIVSA